MHVSAGDDERQHLLRLCRAAMPEATGVVLATLSGAVLAHEVAHVRDPVALATRAARERHPDGQTSALVSHEGGLYLVVFVPPAPAEPWTSSAMPTFRA